jgi:hypothetical protein
MSSGMSKVIDTVIVIKSRYQIQCTLNDSYIFKIYLIHIQNIPHTYSKYTNIYNLMRIINCVLNQSIMIMLLFIYEIYSEVFGSLSTLLS